LTIGGGLAVLLVVMLVTWNYNKANAEAIARANQLISSAQALIVKTYCPGEAARAEQLINSLKYARNS
jgi:hypothetical protein